MKITEYDRPPNDSSILKGWVGDVHFADSFKADILSQDNLSVDDLATMIMAAESPEWIKMLERLRDSVGGLFGLKTGLAAEQKEEKRDSAKYAPGDKVGFFPVIAREDSEIVMGLDDRHLYFRASVLFGNNKDTGQDSVYITTAVKFHNIWGRIYFLPVKPFHKIIVKQSIKRFLKQHKELVPTGE